MTTNNYRLTTSTADFKAREILANISGMQVSDPLDSMTKRIIFGVNPLKESAIKDLKTWIKSLREGDTDGDVNILSASLMPSRIHFNGPVTVVIWEDGSKTVVRRAKDIPDDPYTAFCAALAKKVYGNNTRVKKILHDKTYVPKKKKEDENIQIQLPPLNWDGNPSMREEK